MLFNEDTCNSCVHGKDVHKLEPATDKTPCWAYPPCECSDFVASNDALTDDDKDGILRLAARASGKGSLTVGELKALLEKLPAHAKIEIVTVKDVTEGNMWVVEADWEPLAPRSTHTVHQTPRIDVDSIPHKGGYKTELSLLSQQPSKNASAYTTGQIRLRSSSVVNHGHIEEN